MTRSTCMAGVTLGLLALTTAPALAQGPPGGQGAGPSFCRSGEGHPVHGWQWCVAKGFAPGAHYGPSSMIEGWIEVVWEDVRFQEPRSRSRPRRPQDDRWMGREELTEVTGGVAIRRIEELYGRRTRVDAGVRGRWVRGDFEGVALEVQMGRTPVAYLHDPYERGRVETVFLKPRGR